MAGESTEKPGTTYAVLNMTIELQINGGGWGPECTLGQVHKQSSDSARGMLARGLKDHEFRIIGTPEIKTIVTTEMKR